MDLFAYLMSKKKGVLPSEYTQVAYIESTGTQYINTGFKTSNDMKVIANAVSGFGFIIDNIHYSGPLLGGRKSANNSNFSYVSGNNNDFLGNGTNFLTLLKNTNTDILNLEYSNSSVSIKCGSYTYTNDNLLIDITNPADLYVFAVNTDDVINPGTWKVYSLKIYNNNILVRDFIPCYRNADNVVGLYDLVGDVFYTNQGTGSFTYGAVVPNPDAPQDVHTISGPEVNKGTDVLDKTKYILLEDN